VCFQQSPHAQCGTGVSSLNNNPAAGLLVRTDLMYNHVQFVHGLIYRCASCICQCSLALTLPVLLCPTAAWHETWLATKHCGIGMLPQQCSSFLPNELKHPSFKQSPSFTRKGGERGGGGGSTAGNSCVLVADIQTALWDTETSQFCRETFLVRCKCY